MLDEQFKLIQSIEDTHFWYKARREIIESVLLSHQLLTKKFSVLEIGSANGTNIQYFKSRFNVIKGSEINTEAINIAQQKNPDIEFCNGWLPHNIGFSDEKFDLIFLFDVLEHVEDDLSALIEIKNRLNKNGKLILTVPAYQFLFGKFDEDSFHFRRYNMTTISSVVNKSGFKIGFKSYFNFWLFPLVLISRLVEKLLNKSSGHAVSDQNASFTNKLFYKIMSSEKKWLGNQKSLPFGSSIILIAESN